MVMIWESQLIIVLFLGDTVSSTRFASAIHPIDLANYLFNHLIRDDYEFFQPDYTLVISVIAGIFGIFGDGVLDY